MRSLNLQDSKSERLSNVSRALLLTLVSTLFLIFPTSGVEPARASTPNPALINFNDGTCDLTTAGYLGSGSSADPYMVSDSDALWEVTDCSFQLALADQVAHFRLTNDIDVGQAVKAPTASPIGFTPPSTTKVFNGVLDGNHKIIFGISMSATSHGVGLFGTLGAATISNLVISGSFLTTTMGTKSSDAAGALARNAVSGPIFLLSISNQASVTGVKFVGGLVGHANSNIVVEGSQNSGTVSGTNESVGGLVGFVDGNLVIDSSSNSGAISGLDDVGGLTGFVSGSATIYSSHNTGATVFGTDDVGGLIGYVDSDVTINSSYNTADVTSTGDDVGGLVGLVGGNAFISQSRNEGAVSASDDVGGLIGDADGNVTINSSHNTGDVTSPGNDIGGLVGTILGHVSILQSWNTGNVSASDDVGGLIGEASGSATISLSYNTGDVSGGSGSDIGGLLGHAEGIANLFNSYNQGDVSGGADVGGLVGDMRVGGQVKFSSNSGVITGTLPDVGGLVGHSKLDIDFLDSSNQGSTFGTTHVGGLIGNAQGNANITSSYNTGLVSGTVFSVGGLVGYVDEYANIISSYNTGVISGGSEVAGLVGWVTRDANIISSYNTGTVSGSIIVGGLVGLVSASANITFSHNTAPVSGSQRVGGLLGSVNVDANINSSYNTGPVLGLSAVGGLLGSAQVDANINSSFNTGPVSGSSAVGGLVGGAEANANITSSYNIGSISGSSIVGGLLGGAGTNASIDSSYNTGPVSGATDVDGLAGVVFGTITTTSAYSSVASDHVAISTLADMKLASTYVGFNFTNTWGFGSCTDNQGFPMLRIFAEISNYNSVACGFTPPPQSTPSPGSAPAPVQVLQPLPEIDQTKIQTAAGDQQLLTGERFELIRSATINGMPATISQLTATSLVLTIPALAAGNYSLDLETSNGRISFQGLVEISEASLNPAQLGSTFSVITGLNPRSSWLNRTALAELEKIFTGKSVVTCISYNDRPGLVARKKALSRAMHACRVAEQLGLETKVFVYGKAPDSADTVKILFR